MPSSRICIPATTDKPKQHDRKTFILSLYVNVKVIDCILQEDEISDLFEIDLS